MSLRQYITEAEVRQHIPEAGDVFAIELEDGTLLETYIMSIDGETILLDATPKMISVLREWADLEGEADDVLFEGQFKQSMHQAAESMSLEDFVERYGHLFSPKEAEQFWNGVNSTGQEQVHEYHDYRDEQDVAHQDSGEYDYEGDMAKDELQTIVRAARRLTGMLDDNENMPEWVQSKITKAADYVDTAADYIESNQDEQGVAEGVSESKNFGPDTPYEVKPGEDFSLVFQPGKRSGVHYHMNSGMVADPFYFKLNGKMYSVTNQGDGIPKEVQSGGLEEQGMDEAKYQGREVPLGKPMRGDVKKFKVYVRDPSSGNIKKVNFGHGGTSAKRAGQKTMKIRKSDPARRRSFRARHNCDNPGPRTKARYWSCRKW